MVKEENSIKALLQYLCIINWNDYKYHDMKNAHEQIRLFDKKQFYYIRKEANVEI